MFLFRKVLTRPPTRSLAGCVSSNPLKHDVNFERALEQYRNYVRTLRDLGVDVVEMPPLEEYPDSVFIQDTGVAGAASRRAMISRLGAESRRGEERDVEGYLKREGYRVVRVEEPGTIDGGDVVVTDVGTLLVGLSGRTNPEGARYLARAFPGVEVRHVRVKGVLHLLSAVKYIGDHTLVYMPGKVDTKALRDYRLLEAPRERMGLNFMYMGDGVALAATGTPKLARLLKDEGLNIVEVDISEYWKCDGTMTCLSFPLYNVL